MGNHCVAERKLGSSNKRKQMKTISLLEFFRSGTIDGVRLGASPDLIVQSFGSPRGVIPHGESPERIRLLDYELIEFGFDSGSLKRIVILIDLADESSKSFIEIFPAELVQMKSVEACLKFLGNERIGYEFGRKPNALEICTTDVGTRIYCKVRSTLSPPRCEWSLASAILSTSIGWMD